MKRTNTSLNLWAHQTAQTHGASFQYETYSCVPIFSENEESKQIAFLLSKDNQLLLVHQDAALPEHRQVWNQVCSVYLNNGGHLLEPSGRLPSETWFG